MNNYDEPVLYTCTNGGYLNGVSSVHDNKREDRRWKFRCCTPESGKYFPLIWFVKTTQEFKIPLASFSFMTLFCLPPLNGWKTAEKAWLKQTRISLSIFLKDITTKTAYGPIMSTTGMNFLTTLFHSVTLSGVWIAFTTTKKSKYDID